MRRRSQTIDTNKRRTRRNYSRNRKSISLDIPNSTYREIWAIIYICIAVLTTLSLYNKLGIVGEAWANMIKPIFGWGIYGLPVALFIGGFLMLLNRNINFGITKLFGLFLMAIASLGTIHLRVPTEDMFDLAALGSHGGYIGFVSAFLSKSIIGELGAQIVFIAIFLISILITFEVSIASLLEFLKPQMPITIEKVNIIEANGRKKRLRINTDGEVEEIGENEIDFDKINIIAPEKPKELFGTRMAINKKDNEDLIEEFESQQKNTTQKEHIPWEYPPLNLLDNKVGIVDLDDKFLKEKAEIVKRKLAQFGVEVTMTDIHVGPTVVQYTLKPAEDVKLSKITGLKNDLALALSAHSIRIEAPIPGKNLVGIELPNQKRATVYMRELMETPEYKNEKSKLKIALGRTVTGEPIIADIAKMPHLLIAGATGSGKSVAANSFLISLLYNNSPEELKFIMIDPKRVELKKYNSIPHLLTPVITEPEKAATALKWCTVEMNRRYKILSDHGFRNIDEYNSKEVEEKMPKIIIMIDELADLMMTSGKDVESSICRIAQMARAVGMHLIVATQRPSVDVVTGLIKANIPARIAFAVASGIDSRTMINCFGAEDLLGNGDMLYLSGALGRLLRIQGIYISTEEVDKVTTHLKCTECNTEYIDEITASRNPSGDDEENAYSDGNQFSGDTDTMLEGALNVIKQTGKASASLLQRRLSIGYARAARLLDIMEEKGYIGPSNGAKPREIFM